MALNENNNNKKILMIKNELEKRIHGLKSNNFEIHDYISNNLVTGNRIKAKALMIEYKKNDLAIKSIEELVKRLQRIYDNFEKNDMQPFDNLFLTKTLEIEAITDITEVNKVLIVTNIIEKELERASHSVDILEEVIESELISLESKLELQVVKDEISTISEKISEFPEEKGKTMIDDQFQHRDIILEESKVEDKELSEISDADGLVTDEILSKREDTKEEVEEEETFGFKEEKSDKVKKKFSIARSDSIEDSKTGFLSTSLQDTLQTPKVQQPTKVEEREEVDSFSTRSALESKPTEYAKHSTLPPPAAAPPTISPPRSMPKSPSTPLEPLLERKPKKEPLPPPPPLQSPQPMAMSEPIIEPELEEEEEEEELLEDIVTDIEDEPLEKILETKSKKRKKSVMKSNELHRGISESKYLDDEKLEESEIAEIKKIYSQVSYYDRVIPFNNYPLIVKLSHSQMKKQKRKTNIFTGERQTSKDEEVFETDVETVEVVPICPGCLVSPATRIAPLNISYNELDFTVAPLVNGKIDARIEIRTLDRKLIHQIDIPCVSKQSRLAKTIAIVGSVIGIVPSALDYLFNLDINDVVREQLSKDFPAVTDATSGINLIIVAELVIFVASLSLAGFLFYRMRPKKASKGSEMATS